jgi:Na+:H+ antiporter, NhaA family
MLATRLFKEFFASEKSGGILLAAITTLSLTIANLGYNQQLSELFHQRILGMSIEHWVNDGLMFLFFLLIGLELEREIYEGELSSVRNATLPVIAAVGGMAIPALLHFLLNRETSTQSGAGIPTATDIAFTLALLSLFGKRVPYPLKVFVAALAIADDLGAILVIAVCYSKAFSLAYLSLAVLSFAALCCMNRAKVKRLLPYLVGGALLWYFLLHSGIHATIGGVLLAFAVPFTRKQEECVSHRLQSALHYPVSWIVLPIFAFVNTSILIPSDWSTGLQTPNSIGIILGLAVGKPLGIVGFCLLAIGMGIGKLPEGVALTHLVGAGILAGIGFTMSIFVSLLAFESQDTIESAKIAVLVGSVVSSIVGAAWFVLMVPSQEPVER